VRALALRYALSISAAAAFLAGCGTLQQAQYDTQLAASAQGAMPENRTIVANAARDGSRIKPNSSSGDLLYVSELGDIDVYTYPGGKSVATLTGNVGFGGLCSDTDGNVFTAHINDSGESSTIYEYAHGGASPIATLSDPGTAFGCAFDPTTGNLAVANNTDDNNPDDEGDVAIYPSETGPPTIYYNESFFRYYFCAYDGEGNLYITAVVSASGGPKPVLVGLVKGGSSLVQISLSKALFWESTQFYPSVQWDGQHMTVSSALVDRKVHPIRPEFQVYRLSISGSTATVIGTTTLKTGDRNFHMGQLSIQGKTLLAPYINKGQKVGFWSYPDGGMPSPIVSVSAPPGQARLWGLTVSVSSPGRQIRK
jgi:hypothetical protein